ncbi:hypothetical protein [Dorea sp. AM10-31]|uniref:hypothetical protein n=1 Tax=Dorea sp. AM10-31 TaxID=2293098 RepID=UPI000E427901|nr:hypothetical protein [Dorea sp. AM10-31]RGF22111.1 hypothetical protein DW125_08990 [Dorea sp. AM10-31]
MAKKNSRFSEEYLSEAEKRIEEMEKQDYEFPEPFSKTNWILAIATILISGAFLIGGYWM